MDFLQKASKITAMKLKIQLLSWKESNVAINTHKSTTMTV